MKKRVLVCVGLVQAMPDELMKALLLWAARGVRES